MSEITLSSRHRRAEKKHFAPLKLEGRSGVRTRDLRLSKQPTLTTVQGPSPNRRKANFHFRQSHLPTQGSFFLEVVDEALLNQC